MRWLLVGSCVALVVSPVQVRSQTPSDSNRLGLAFGSSWSRQPRLIGLQLRATYDLTPRDRMLSFRAEAGGRWTPTQAFTTGSILYGEGSSYTGCAQSADLSLGVAAVLTPLPKARISPSLVMGVAAVQSWRGGNGYYRMPDGTPVASATPLFSRTRGALAVTPGLGIRFRLGHRVFQLEARRVPLLHTTSLTIGTRRN